MYAPDRHSHLALRYYEEAGILPKAARIIERMRYALELGLRCGCVRIEDCSLTPADIPQRKTPDHNKRGVRT